MQSAIDVEQQFPWIFFDVISFHRQVCAIAFWTSGCHLLYCSTKEEEEEEEREEKGYTSL